MVKYKKKRGIMYLIGQSQDLHQLVPGRILILGGVTIKENIGLLGESDADVLLHAIIEAILGSINEGDLGTHFAEEYIYWPDSDSQELLAYAIDLLDKRGYEIVNIDSLIICQNIFIRPYRLQMQENISKITKCSRVNVKATTNELQDSMGKGDSIVSQAIVQVKLKENSIDQIKAASEEVGLGKCQDKKDKVKIDIINKEVFACTGCFALVQNCIQKRQL